MKSPTADAFAKGIVLFPQRENALFKGWKRCVGVYGTEHDWFFSKGRKVKFSNRVNESPLCYFFHISGSFKANLSGAI